MLQKQHRLLGPIGHPTHVVRSPFFTLKYRENDNTDIRFGFVVSKKVSKSAVVRNRLKRVIRSEVESSLEQIKPGYDALFIITSVFEDTEKARKEVKNSLQKHLWQNI